MSRTIILTTAFLPPALAHTRTRRRNTQQKNSVISSKCHCIHSLDPSTPQRLCVENSRRSPRPGRDVLYPHPRPC
ncbi:hypothetical protein BKA81DRAFT_361642 [Phyllosticta paracitricarpa]